MKVFPRFIAFYLPQFHPIPENDHWWGTGFTEWRNVSQARPRFPGHYQPHEPADLGYYDLRVGDTREAQAELARQYGIDAFCYYHYWFHGKRLLERPIEAVLASGEPTFPFLLCWANESWSRAWDGSESDLTQEQTYSAEDDEAHIRALLPIFSDYRYLRIDGKPVFLVWRSDQLPDARRTTDVWRRIAGEHGVELYLCRVEASGASKGDPRERGFDAAVGFEPDGDHLGPRIASPRWRRLLRKALRPRSGLRWNHVYAYQELVARALEDVEPGYLRYPCVTPSWDNSPRRKVWARILVGSDPATYGCWLREVLRRFAAPSPSENLVFINAWNEWAEGCHLEPDLRHGRAFLEATLEAKSHVGVGVALDRRRARGENSHFHAQ